jgi:CelD/BcsL family acetyltransferase involved in cellulose biosynthesis
MPESVGRQPNPFLQLPTAPHRSGAYVATLGTDWEDYYAAKRSASTRKTERRKLRQLEEHGPVRSVDAATPASAALTVSTLITQKAAFFARLGVENIFARPGYRDFYLALATDPGLRSLVHVGRLEVGPAIAAANVGLRFGDCYFLILSSYDDGALARLGPGRVHLQELIKQAIAEGLRSFDFTVGDEPYKLDWADRKLILHDHLAAATSGGFLPLMAMRMTGRAKRFVKQTPVLWHLAVRARSIAARLRGAAAPAP